MASHAVAPNPAAGRQVTAETLTVAPAVLGRELAEPWRRLAAMLVDLVAVALLSFLSRPFLALGSGILLAVIFGHASAVPTVLRLVRWVSRALALVVIALGLLALGHGPTLRTPQARLDALLGGGESAAMKQTVVVMPDASWSEMRTVNAELQEQVRALKAEIRQRHALGGSWTLHARALAQALGVTFGWSGVYFTLLGGAWNGRTLGKRVFGTRAVRVDGAPLTFFDAFIRHGGYVAGVALGLVGFLKLLWEPNRQAVEDRIAGTVVIKD